MSHNTPQQNADFRAAWDATNAHWKASAPLLEWAQLWAAMDAKPLEWMPTTEAMYWDMLECVPPRAQHRGAFLVGEPLRHNEQGQALHACFKQIGDKYFARNLTLEQFRSEI